MRIAYIEEFIALTQTANYTDAARQLHVTQPTLSKHMSALEKGLGVKLIERNAPGFALTEAGKVFLEHAVVVSNEYRKAVEAVRAVAKSGKNVLKVGYLRNAAFRLLMPLQQWFEANRPDIELHFLSVAHDGLRSALANKRVDVLITIDDDESMHDDCDFFPIYLSSFILIVPRGHRLASLDSVDFPALAGETLVLPSLKVWPGIRSIYMRYLSEGDIDVVEVEDEDTLRFMLESGKGIAIVAGYNRKFYSEERFAFIDLSGTRMPSVPVSAAWLRGAGEGEPPQGALGDFLEALRSIKKELD